MKVKVIKEKTKKSKFKAGDMVTLKWTFFVVDIPAFNTDGRIFVRKTDNPSMQFLVTPDEVTRA